LFVLLKKQIVHVAFDFELFVDQPRQLVLELFKSDHSQPVDHKAETIRVLSVILYLEGVADHKTVKDVVDIDARRVDALEFLLALGGEAAFDVVLAVEQVKLIFHFVHVGAEALFVPAFHLREVALFLEELDRDVLQDGQGEEVF
jgi:hypothetical protein